MKVLVADKFEKSGIDGLTGIGCEVMYRPELSDQALAEAIESNGVQALVVRSTKVTAAMLSSSLRMIVRAGAGVNTIDVKAATAKGVVVANCPGKNSIAVAELVFGLILALDRRIPDNVADLRAGKWNKKEYAKARGLFGCPIGLLGFGSIGREIAKRAAAFGMPVVAWDKIFGAEDRGLTAAEARMFGLEIAVQQVPITLAPSAEEVAARVQILSIHLPFAPDTKGLVNAAVLGQLGPGSYLINTSRGEIVDQDALRAAIRDRHLRVGLDVFAAEPSAATGEFTDPIVQEAGVYGTHHIVASTDQAQEAIALETVRIIKQFRETGVAPNAVNA
jgi:D-3-phosphoglycerate dehydrogenase